jgi:hypothetical protein
MTLIDMFAHATKILNTNSHPAAELRGIYSIKKREVTQVLQSVEFYIESLRIKNRLSNKKIESANTVQNALLLGIRFIAKEQEPDGQWKDSPVNGWLSGYWTTGYVLNAVASCKEEIMASINTEIIFDVALYRRVGRRC